MGTVLGPTPWSCTSGVKRTRCRSTRRRNPFTSRPTPNHTATHFYCSVSHSTVNSGWTCACGRRQDPILRSRRYVRSRSAAFESADSRKKTRSCFSTWPRWQHVEIAGPDSPICSQMWPETLCEHVPARATVDHSETLLAPPVTPWFPSSTEAGPFDTQSHRCLQSAPSKGGGGEERRSNATPPEIQSSEQGIRLAAPFSPRVSLAEHPLHHFLLTQ